VAVAIAMIRQFQRSHIKSADEPFLLTKVGNLEDHFVHFYLTTDTWLQRLGQGGRHALDPAGERVKPLSARLETEGPNPVQAAMAPWMAQESRDRETAHKEQAYFAHHADRMHHPDYRRLGLPIGSGRIEGVANTLVQQLAHTGRWDEFWGTRPFAKPERRIA